MEPQGNPVDKNLILDEAMNQINRLQAELLIKNAFIRQLQAQLAATVQQPEEEKKEETV